MKKKLIAAALVLALLMLTACGGSPSTQSSAAELLDAALSSQSGANELTLTTLNAADEGFSDRMTKVYGLGANTWGDGAVCFAGGVKAFELAAIRPSGSGSTEDILKEYVRQRAGAFYGYAPEQAAMLESAAVFSWGDWVFMLICPDSQAAEQAVKACFDSGASSAPRPSSSTAPAISSGWTAFNPPNKVSMAICDTSAIINAYKSQDSSGLSQKDKAVLDMCGKTISQIIKSGASEYEKELAVHDWMIKWGNYDEDEYSPAGPSPDSSTPYGFLINKKGICLGYATTFGLFMDLIGIENRLVIGASFDSTEDHAWNMVKLDGDWYCVDTTWDDPMGWSGSITYTYFNITSDTMRETDHQWDYTDVPEAAGTKYSYKGS